MAAGAHTRDTTPTALSKLVQPYIAKCVQRQYLSNWLRTVTTAAGSSSCVEKLPEQVLMPGGALCPTITAFVAAVGQQMDIVDAAVHEIEVRATMILFSKLSGLFVGYFHPDFFLFYNKNKQFSGLPIFRLKQNPIDFFFFLWIKMSKKHLI